MGSTHLSCAAPFLPARAGGPMWLGLMYRILSNLFKSVTSHDRFQQNSIEDWSEQKRSNKKGVGSFDPTEPATRARAEFRTARKFQNASECFRILQYASECFTMLQNASESLGAVRQGQMQPEQCQNLRAENGCFPCRKTGGRNARWGRV